MEKTKPRMVATVWRHWKPVLKKNRWLLLITFLGYNVAMYFDLMLKPIWWRDIVDNFTITDPWDSFRIIIIISIGAWICNRTADWAIVIAESRIIKDLKDYALRGLLHRNTTFYTNHPLGGLVAKVKRFANESETVIDQFVFTISRSTVLVLYLLVYSFFMIPKLTMILFVWTLLFCLVSIIFSRFRTKYDLMSSEEDSKTTGRLSDVLMSVLTLRMSSAIPREFLKFKGMTSIEEEKRRRAWLIGNVQWAIQAFLVFVLEIWVMYIVISLVLNKTETIGTAVMIQSYIGSLSMNMWNLGQSIVRLRRGIAESYEMACLLDSTDDETTEPGFQKENLLHNGIEIKDVSFWYGNKIPVLRNLDFTFEPGKRYGLVGGSGAGKTTLTKLLTRSYDPTSGSIMFGGIKTIDMDKDILRSFIAYVPQQQTFPSRTVREIISLAKENATDAEILSAAKKASCDFIWEKLPHGFDTHIGERGVKLSGGEAQRLAIAAAILKDAPIVIMDEPTSALDSETEHYIQESIRKNFSGKTLIVIAHRLSTVAILDEVLFMKNGTIIDAQPHGILLETLEEYRSMWQMQTSPVLV